MTTKEGIIVCGGPSIKDVQQQDIDVLPTLAVNFAAFRAGLRTDHLVACDPPNNNVGIHNSYPEGAFADDYTTIKWIRRNFYDEPLMKGRPRLIRDYQNVRFFSSCAGCHPRNFLENDRVPIGVGEDSADFRCDTMIAALKLMWGWNFRRVYLVACDWTEHHDPRVTDQKWFGHQDWVESVYVRLRPLFDKSGYEVINTNHDSRLEVFEFGDLPIGAMAVA